MVLLCLALLLESKLPESLDPKNLNLKFNLLKIKHGYHSNTGNITNSEILFCKFCPQSYVYLTYFPTLNI